MQSSKASIPRQGCPAAGHEEFCCFPNASWYCTRRTPDTGYACTPSCSQPLGLKDLCSGESPDQRTTHWFEKTSQAHLDACPTDSRFLKMPESCNTNWRIKVMFACFGFLRKTSCSRVSDTDYPNTKQAPKIPTCPHTTGSKSRYFLQPCIFRSRLRSLFLPSGGPLVNLQYYYLIVKQKNTKTFCLWDYV